MNERCQVGDECSTLSGHLLGHCVVHELDEIQVVSLGQSVFADVSVVQLDNNVVVDNSLQTVHSNHVQQTRRYASTISPT